MPTFLRAALLLLILPLAAQAATIRVTGGVDLAGEGKVSGASGVTEERFGTTTCATGSGFSLASSVVFPAQITLSKTSVKNRRLRPLNDTSCYLAIGPDDFPDRSGLATGVIAAMPGKIVDYVGFYFGSIDEYQSVTFASADGTVVPLINELTGEAVVDGALFGNRLAAEFGQPLYSSLYVEVFGGPSEDLSQFVFRTTNWGIEVDNFAWTYADAPLPPGVNAAVPAPPAVAFIAPAALFAIGGSRLRRRV